MCHRTILQNKCGFVPKYRNQRQLLRIPLVSKIPFPESVPRGSNGRNCAVHVSYVTCHPVQNLPCPRRRHRQIRYAICVRSAKCHIANPADARVSHYVTCPSARSDACAVTRHAVDLTALDRWDVESARQCGSRVDEMQRPGRV